MRCDERLSTSRRSQPASGGVPDAQDRAETSALWKRVWREKGDADSLLETVGVPFISFEEHRSWSCDPGQPTLGHYLERYEISQGPVRQRIVRRALLGAQDDSSAAARLPCGIFGRARPDRRLLPPMPHRWPHAQSVLPTTFLTPLRLPTQ